LNEKVGYRFCQEIRGVVLQNRYGNGVPSHYTPDSRSPNSYIKYCSGALT